MSPLSALWTNWLITGTWPIVGKSALDLLSPVLLMWCGALLGSLYFAPYLTRHKAWSKLFDRKLMPGLAAVGILGTALPLTVILYALNYTTAVNASIVAEVEVVYSLIITAIFLGEKPCKRQLAGTALVLFGALLIAFKDRFSPHWKGDIIIMLAPISYQLSHTFAKKLPANLEPTFIAAGRLVFALLALTPLMAFMALSGKLHFVPEPNTLWLVLFWGLINNGLNSHLWYMSIRYMDLSKATAIILSYPVLTLALSFTLGLEKVQPYQVIGLACALTGALWITSLAHKSHRKVRSK